MKTKTLELTQENAITLYREGNNETKNSLEILFGKELFMPKRISSFEEALKITGKLALDVFSENDTKDEIAYKKLKLIRKCLVGDWVPDWNNSNEYKYWPVFDMRSNSGFGFSYSYYGAWRTRADAGSRLCFPSSELAEYAGRTFLAEYKDLQTEE